MTGNYLNVSILTGCEKQEDLFELAEFGLVIYLDNVFWAWPLCNDDIGY